MHYFHCRLKPLKRVESHFSIKQYHRNAVSLSGKTGMLLKYRILNYHMLIRRQRKRYYAETGYE